MPDAFHPDRRLVDSGRFVVDLPLCRVMLRNESTYPWLYLIPRRHGIREIFELSADDRARLVEEISKAGRVLQSLYAPEKINTAALGNEVPDLHIHVFGRYKTDPAWPRPVWALARETIPYAEGDYQKRVDDLKKAFAVEE